MSRKTVKDAVKGLPKDVADHTVRMFTRTGYLDFYEGDLEMYLVAIESDTKRTAERLREVNRRLEEARRAVIY